jgi:translocation and assembly module TamA
MNAARHAFAPTVLALALGLLQHTAPAIASIKVELAGVDDPSGATRDNVLAYLSLARYATLDDLSDDVVNRIFNRAEGEIEDALKPFGYYDPKVEASLTPDGHNWIARLSVTVGEPVKITAVNVAITGAGADETFLRELIDASPLIVGRQLDHGAYERLKGDLQQRATANGYLDARFTTNELLVDPAHLSATATLILDTGPRYRFGVVEIEQDAVDRDFVQRFLRFKPGDWFDSTALLKTQFALDDTQYFRIVEVLPGDRDPVTLTVPVRIDARRNKRQRYTVGVGYDSEFGPRLRLTWNDRLINSEGHRSRLQADLAETNQQLHATYVVPIGDPALEKLQFDLTATNAVLADAHVKTFEVKPSTTHIYGSWQRVAFVDLSRTESIAGGLATRDTLVVPGVSLAPVPPAVTGEFAPSNVAPGFYAEVLGSTTALGSGSSFLRFHVLDDWHFRIAPHWRLLLRAEIGATLAKNFDDLPVRYRFFAGGDRSVRGFGLNSLSPTDTVIGSDGGVSQQLRAGGKHVIVGSIELERDLPRNLALAVFTDAGNAFNRFGAPLEYSAGVGIRYKLPFVSFGLDVAQPLSQSGSPRLHLNIAPVF